MSWCLHFGLHPFPGAISCLQSLQVAYSMILLLLLSVKVYRPRYSLVRFQRPKGEQSFRTMRDNRFSPIDNADILTRIIVHEKRTSLLPFPQLMPEFPAYPVHHMMTVFAEFHSFTSFPSIFTIAAPLGKILRHQGQYCQRHLPRPVALLWTFR